MKYTIIFEVPVKIELINNIYPCKLYNPSNKKISDKDLLKYHDTPYEYNLTDDNRIVEIFTIDDEEFYNYLIGVEQNKYPAHNTLVYLSMFLLLFEEIDKYLDKKYPRHIEAS